jgi:hypothetical protein
LLALIDTAALGLTRTGEAVEAATNDSGEAGRAATEHSGAPVWLIAYLIGALRTEAASAPVRSSTRTAPPAPVRQDTPSSAAAPVHAQQRTTTRTEPAVAHGNDDRTDDELLAVVRHHAATEHDGGPMSQRAIRRVTGVGTPRAKRLAELAGWAAPTDDGDAPVPQVRGQLQLVAEPGENPTEQPDTTENDTTKTHDLETSSSR